MTAVPMSPYVAGIRRRIGHDLLLLPAVGTALFDSDGRLLLARHVDTGCWGTVGGAVDPGESPTEAARREVREETGLEVELLGIVGAFGGEDFAVTYANGDRAAYTVVLFGGRVLDGRVELQVDEIDEIGWFAEQEAATLPRRPDMDQLLCAAYAWQARGAAADR